MKADTSHGNAALQDRLGLDSLSGVVLMVAAMTIFGLAPLLFGGLAEEKRLGLSQVGLAIPIQAIVMGVVNLGADIILPRKRQRLMTLLCVCILAPLQLMYIGQSGMGALILCALCSIPQGLLLWIAMGVIARSSGPTRLMAYSEIGITLLKILVSGLLAAVLLPRWGVDAGFVVAAIIVSIGIFAIFAVPDNFQSPISVRKQTGDGMPLKGWISLAVVMLVWNGTMSIMSYLLPLASAAGLTAQTAHNAFVALLIGQITGAVVAAMASKHLPYHIALGIGALIAIGTLGVFEFHMTAWQFWAASAAFGFTFAFSAPFLMPMMIAADPTRQAASKFMGAALLGSALGPLITSRIVISSGAHGALYIADGAFLLAIIIVVFLHVTTSRNGPVAANK